LDHNTGISDFTSRTSDWEMKYSESFPNRQHAMKREKEIKKKKSRRYIEWIIANKGKSQGVCSPDSYWEKGHPDRIRDNLHIFFQVKAI